MWTPNWKQVCRAPEKHRAGHMIVRYDYERKYWCKWCDIEAVATEDVRQTRFEWA